MLMQAESSPILTIGTQESVVLQSPKRLSLPHVKRLGGARRRREGKGPSETTAGRLQA